MLVYIAGPYTHPDPGANVSAAVDVANQLRGYGCAPFVPHLWHYWNSAHQHTYECWMSLCLEWLPMCDALVRMPGESAGADAEVNRANELGIPVFRSVDDLVKSLVGPHEVSSPGCSGCIGDSLGRVRSEGD